MQSLATSSALPAGQKNYVFVDEHNRHKRLKVMRACEGCRRRKIKCDSATTNSWPCAACTRLKLHCVPPVGGIEGEPNTTSTFETAEAAVDYQDYSQSEADDTSMPTTTHQPYESSFNSRQHSIGHQHQYASNFPKPEYSHHEHSHNDIFMKYHPFNDATTMPYPSDRPDFPLMRSDSDSLTQASSSRPTAEDLIIHLGDLQIAENGTAPYLRQQMKDNREPEAPVAEPELKIAAFSTNAGSQIRIPPALMPSQEDALRYFQIFFRDVHPYLPVLCRNQFYHQWHTDKELISPLVLEAVFACAGRMSNDPAEGAQWLALANKHEACFLDSPRLSTVQALLLLLKARESQPKKGYYYRSWMTVKTIVSMAKDLDLHEHHELHKSDEDCGSDPVECLTKTRIWQAIMIFEMMVGASQGRSEFGVDPNSVDISPNPPCADIDDFEKSISRQFAYFVRNARNIRLIADVAYRLKKKKEWQTDQELLTYNMAFTKWPDDLPQDLKIVMPSSGGRPTLSSHFLGNMHSHYHLGIVMLRRPQLSAAVDDTWKRHMSVCYSSAKTLCILQEAILANFELAGLDCMLRGLSYHIYAVLTCVMIHLIAITSPEPRFNKDARDFFVRHMRILERCIAAWPMPETEAQINGLRAAFSADMSKPFELNPSFPLDSPPPNNTEHFDASPLSQQTADGQKLQYQQNPRQDMSVPHTQPYLPTHMNHAQQVSYLATPPVSAVSNDSQPHSPQFQQAQSLEQSSYNDIHSVNYYDPTSVPDHRQWNPTPIINQFNTAFAISASVLAPPPSAYGSSPPQNAYQNLPQEYVDQHSPTYTRHHYMPQAHQQYQHDHQLHTDGAYYVPQQPRANHQRSPSYPSSNSNPMPVSQPHPPRSQPVHQQQPIAVDTHNSLPPDGVFVTPKEWQQSVASVYDPVGLKRRWNYS